MSGSKYLTLCKKCKKSLEKDGMKFKDIQSSNLMLMCGHCNNCKKKTRVEVYEKE